MCPDRACTAFPLLSTKAVYGKMKEGDKEKRKEENR